MSYIYHLIPKPFMGTDLIPLNQMDKETSLYQKHAKKYIGREDLMNESIPKLNCKWNDVVQFSALDPQIIVNELIKYQANLFIDRTSYFKVHIDEIIGKYESVVFDSKSRVKGSFAIGEEEVFHLSKDRYKELSKVPQETIEYWSKVRNEGGKFLWFPFITHVFVRGNIDTSNFQQCELRL